MKRREYSAILLFSIVLLQLVGSAIAQDNDTEYEYYYEDEASTVTSIAATTTTTTTTTKRPVATTRNGRLVSSTTKRKMSQRYQASRPDVIVNIISDMYGLQGMRQDSRSYGGNRYTGYSSRYSSQYESPLANWYTIRQPYRPVSRPQPPPEPLYIDYYEEDFYDYYYDSPPPAKNRAEAQQRGTNRATFNFMMSALGSRRN